MNDSPSALAATVIAVVSIEGHDHAAEKVRELAETASVRGMVISLGDRREPEIDDVDGAVSIRGLVPEFLNNAVASLRLSSLPALGWWQTPDTTSLPDFAVLVDRLVLDVPDPIESWAMIPHLASRTAVADIRWTALTRWRDLLAQFFDMPEVRTELASVDRLEVRGADRHQGSLLAGWLRDRLPDAKHLRFEHKSAAGQDVDFVRLSGGDANVSLELLEGGSCVRTAVQLRTANAGARIVPIEAEDVVGLLTDELRLRARDIIFEHAAREALRL